MSLKGHIKFKVIERDFYENDTAQVARLLLGKYLCSQKEDILQVGKIVEVEAYLGEYDLACHTSKGRTKRTEVMFGPPGFSYVYLIYGIHHCFNVVTEQVGKGCAVLIRALEPVQGIETKTSGPGLLSKAIGIDKSLNGHDLLKKPLFLTENPDEEKISIIEKPRIGVAYAREWALKPLRFYIDGNRYVSKK